PQLQQVAPFEQHPATADAAAGAALAEKRIGHGGLAAAGFPGEPQDLAPADGEGDIADDILPAPPAPIVDAEGLDLHDGLRARGPGSGGGGDGWGRRGAHSRSPASPRWPMRRARPSVKRLTAMTRIAMAAAGAMTGQKEALMLL